MGFILHFLIFISTICSAKSFSLYSILVSYLSLVDGNPVSGGEPLVALDIIDSIPEVAKALG